jgi:hypothetical protein
MIDVMETHCLQKIGLQLHSNVYGHATAQVLSRRPLIAEDRIESQASTCEIYG